MAASTAGRRGPAWQQQLRPAQKRLLAMADLQPGERVLDVACGTGLVTIPAARCVGPGGKVCAVDLSEQMVDVVRQKARRHQLGQVLARRMDAEALDFPAAERFATRLHYNTPEDACKAAFLGGAVALAYRRFDEATREGAHAEYLASIEPYRNGSGYDIPGEFVVAKGCRPSA